MSRAGALDAGGRLDLRGLAAVVACADAVVSPDTVPAHLAAAMGTPVVSLCTSVACAPRRRPWGAPHVVLGDHDPACRAAMRAIAALTEARVPV